MAVSCSHSIGLACNMVEFLRRPVAGVLPLLGCIVGVGLGEAWERSERDWAHVEYIVCAAFEGIAERPNEKALEGSCSLAWRVAQLQDMGCSACPSWARQGPPEGPVPVAGWLQCACDEPD